MKKLLLLNILVLVATASAALSLTLLDNIVHSTLYNYGLDFSYEWANPYWNMLRIVQALIGLAAAFTVVSSLYAYKRYVCSKSAISLTKGEERVASPPTISASKQLNETQLAKGLVKCTHCQRVFAQPLRMLDFRSDRPRIINICPFCNEFIEPILQGEEKEKGRKFVRNGKEKGQGEKTVAASA